MYTKPNKKQPAKKPTASLDIEGYYSCSREEAKELFQPFILLDGMYLVRPSESQGALYTLSVTKDHKVYNYRIQQEDKTKLFLIQDRTAEKFKSVPQLIQTYKEKPINPQLNIKLVAPLVQGTKRKQNSKAFLSNYSKTQEGKIEDIPGLHRYLPRSEIKNVMEAYLNRPGTFLLRPSLTTEGSLTLTVVHKYELLHFKITQDQNTREICVASKKFPNFHELLEFYKYNPLKIRSRPNDNILLTFPLPVDKYLENIHKQAQDELYSELAGEQPLPEGWTEHFDEKHQKKYYYNISTKETKWIKPLPPPPPPPSKVRSTSSNVTTNAPALPPARKSLTPSSSAPVISPSHSDRFSKPSMSSAILEDSFYIECGASDLDEDNYKAVESPTSKLPPVPEDDTHPKLKRVSSAPYASNAPTGTKRMSVIKAGKNTMVEEKELTKQLKEEEKQKALKEKEEKKEAAKKAKEEAKRLKAEEAQRKKDETKRLKEEARQRKEELKRQKQEEKRKVKEEKLQRTFSVGAHGAPRQREEEESLQRTYSTGAVLTLNSPSSKTLSASSTSSGPPPPPPRVDLDPAVGLTSALTPPSGSGPPPPPPRVDLDPTVSQTSALTPPSGSGPPPPPPRVDLDPTVSQTSALTPPSGTGPPPPPPPPPLTGMAAQTTEAKDNKKQIEKERKAAEKQKKQEEERLKKEAAKREKEEAKRKKEEEKQERRMSKSKSVKKPELTPASVEPTPNSNIPAPPPPPPVGGIRAASPPTQSPAPNNPTPADPIPSPIKPLLPPTGKDSDQVLLSPSAPSPGSVPAPPPPPPASNKPPPIPAPTASASVPSPPVAVPAPPPPPPVSAPAPPPPPPISPLPTSSTPASPTSSGLSADDLVAGRSKLTASTPHEKPTQQAGGLGGIMQSAFDQFNDKIGAMRSFVEYSDDEDYEELEDDEDWD